MQKLRLCRPGPLDPPGPGALTPPDPPLGGPGLGNKIKSQPADELQPDCLLKSLFLQPLDCVKEQTIF